MALIDLIQIGFTARKDNEKLEKLKVDNDQEMAQSERNFHSLNRVVGKNQNDI